MASARPADLPVPATRLVGRRGEATAVRALLLETGARLVTLTGAGGVGKTRLAVLVAEELAGSFAGGVHFVALSSIQDPALLPSALSQALGAAETAGQDPEEALTTRLRDARLLLVLDNFEHLVEGAPLIAQLLGAALGIRVLVTSRAPLRVSGEHEFPVPPLALPVERTPPDPRSLARSEAVTLFVQTARAARPAFELDAGNAAAVAGICRRLDGLPLTIELAAARIRVLPPEAMLARIDDSLALLTGGARDVPPRLRTLRAAMDWSYDLLDARDQTLFARLSVFAGGWTLDAAEAVCDPDGMLGVIEGVESLVEKSLVQLVGSRGAEPRFAMLATIREYAAERLERSGKAGAVRRRHAEYYGDMGRRAEPELQGSEQAEWLERLQPEHDNLRAALSWLLGRGEAEAALALAMAVWRFWDLRGYYAEGRLWLDRGLAAGASVSARVRAQVHNVAGDLAWSQGDYPRAVEQLEASLSMRRELGDPVRTSYTLNNLGLVAIDLGEHGRAVELLEESLALRRQSGDPMGEALSLNNLGYAALLRGEYAAAQAFAEESLALFRRIGNSWGVTLALTNLGRAALESGEHDRAAEILAESLRLSEALGERRNIAECLEALAAMAADAGHTESAARTYGSAQGLRDEIGVPLSPIERALQERRLGALRGQGHRDRLEAAMTEGRELRLDEAIERAVGSSRRRT